MFSDALLSFVPLGAPLSIVAGAGVSVRSTVIDLLGAGVGVAPPSIIGNATLFGTDMGIGGLRPELLINVGTAFVTANASTLNVALQAAPDTGSGGNYQPGTWQTLGESGALTAAQLTANQTIFRSPWLPVFPPNLRPRYLSLYFQVPSGLNFTAGTIANALNVTVRDDLANKQAAANYTVV